MLKEREEREDSLSSTTIIGLVVRWGQYVYHPRQCHRDEVAADEDRRILRRGRFLSQKVMMAHA